MTRRPSRVWLWVSGLLVTFLLAAVITLGSFDVFPNAGQWTDVFVFFALTVFIVAALIIFSLVLGRSLLRLWAERRRGQLGVRFKTKMVLGAMAISLLPVLFMFFSSYALLNHSLGRWFPQSVEQAAKESVDLVNDLGGRERERLNAYAGIAAKQLGANHSPEAVKALLDRFMPGVDGILVLDSKGRVIQSAASFPIPEGAPGSLDKTLPSGAEIWKTGDVYSTIGRAPLADGSVIVLRRTTPNVIDRPERINHQLEIYTSESQHYRALKTQLLLALALFTVMLMFAVTWIALYLSNQVTVPIQALADGTRAVSKGDFDYRVETQAQDELGSLVNSFNVMTAQLFDSRRQINEFTRSLQQALQEIESRRKLLETVLENIPTGVISVDAAGNVLRVNSSAARIFGEQARCAKVLPEIVGEQAARDFQALLRRSQRLGAVSRAMELRMAGRVMHAAVTVSALGTGGANTGYLVVVDDLTDLLRAQKLAAWQEVAQRIAHEIKNPLTPIQLSADRLARYVSRRTGEPFETLRDTGLENLVSECATSIGREVESLKSLVDEFSRFVRFPQARLAVADANSIVHQALDVFRGRLDGITVRTDFARELPPIKADGELLRGVVVNLIDNAAEALESSPVKELQLSTRRTGSGDALEIVVADTGCGISPDDKDKLFLPHFSTKDRGTGLGLAIAARVAAEHNGTLRVEDNLPFGSRFILRIPATEVAAAPIASEASRVP
jgi:two-component system nitrogen regulation sensor histidine kinase NtrY